MSNEVHYIDDAKPLLIDLTKDSDDEDMQDIDEDPFHGPVVGAEGGSSSYSNARAEAAAAANERAKAEARALQEAAVRAYAPSGEGGSAGYDGIASDEPTKIDLTRDDDKKIQDSSGECVVCFEYSDSRYALIPCGHFGFCEACARKAFIEVTCCCCRQDVSSYNRIFFP
jgi:hypothetical protein